MIHIISFSLSILALSFSLWNVNQLYFKFCFAAVSKASWAVYKWVTCFYERDSHQSVSKALLFIWNAVKFLADNENRFIHYVLVKLSILNVAVFQLSTILIISVPFKAIIEIKHSLFRLINCKSQM